MKPALALLLTAVALAGCSGSKKDSQPTTPPATQPAAQTPDEWAKRVVDGVFRPLNLDLRVVNGFGSPTLQFYIVNRNASTLRIIKRRLGDLERCNDKLSLVGPPPPGHPQLERIDQRLGAACRSYVKMATTLQEVTLLLSSGRSDVIARGQRLLRSINPLTKTAAGRYAAAIKLAQNRPEFRRAGLRPSI
jgi:hypothetical protein